jgi:hypothetical protein
MWTFSITVVQVASLARTPYWQPFLPLSCTSSLMDAVSLISQHGPSVIPVLRLKPPEQIPRSSITASSPPPIIQGYLTQHAVLSALNKFSGLSWFDSLVGDRTLAQLAHSGLGMDALLHRIDANMPLLTALLTLCQAEQAALPVFEIGTAGKLTIVGEVMEQDAQVLLTDPGAFRRRRCETSSQFLSLVPRERIHFLLETSDQFCDSWGSSLSQAIQDVASVHCRPLAGLQCHIGSAKRR